MRQCHTGDGLTSISLRIASRLQLHAFVSNALCFCADCIFGFVYRVPSPRADCTGVMCGRPTSSCSSLVTKFTDATNYVAADGPS